MKILFLYTELAEYFLSCIKALSLNANVQVSVIHWPVNPEAPFDFEYPEGVGFFNRNDYSGEQLKQLVRSIQPDLIYCSGWLDKDYLNISRCYRNSIPVVLGLDNPWKGNWRQRLGVLVKGRGIRSSFSHCWIPGKPQEEFAKRLGFGINEIRQGVYSCDHKRFASVYESSRPIKSAKFPHVFLFIGRYYEFKGVTELWNAFIKFKKDNSSDWKLWCLGTGNMAPVKHPDIQHFGFVQPRDMDQLLQQAGVFIMPSRFEPWGVALQEMAAAGFPLLCSSEVGAGSLFVRSGVNGFQFTAGDESALLERMRSISLLSDSELNRMGEESFKLSGAITPEIWVKTLLDLNEHMGVNSPSRR